jgi:hypothetical protein
VRIGFFPWKKSALSSFPPARFFDLLYVRNMAHIYMDKKESPADVARWLERRSAEKWPAILGSLSLRRSLCIRENWSGLSFRPTAPEQYIVRPHQGTSGFHLHSSKCGAGSPALFGQRAGCARTAVRGRGTVREGFKATRVGRKRGLSRVEPTICSSVPHRALARPPAHVAHPR